MGSSRSTSGTERLRTLLGIAAALWLVGAVVAVIAGDRWTAISWFCLAAFGAMIASGLAHRSEAMRYSALGLVLVAVITGIGAFLID